MTRQEYNIIIAEACRHDISHESKPGFMRPWFDGIGYGDYDEPIPDYFNDLNAMHDAEEILIKNLGTYWKYCDILAEIVPAVLGKDSHIHATAAQKAEAFLKVINKYKD